MFLGVSSAFYFVPQCLILGQIVGWNGSLTRLTTPSSKPKYMRERTYSMDRDKHVIREPPPKKQTRNNTRCAQLHTETAGNLWVSILVDHSCLGGTHAAAVFNVDIVDFLDAWVVAGGEETLVFNVDIVNLLDPWVVAGGEETLVVNVDIEDLLDPRIAAGGEEKAARLGRLTRQARW